MTVPPTDSQGEDALEQVYDPAVVARIDGYPSRNPADNEGGSDRGRVRRSVAASSLTAALLRGVDAVLDDDDDDAVVEVERQPVPPVRAVEVHLVWGRPSRSVAVVRPWLLPS